ncbi:MAG: TonB-dependent receptor [Acidobacteriota bacterium]
MRGPVRLGPAVVLATLLLGGGAVSPLGGQEAAEPLKEEPGEPNSEPKPRFEAKVDVTATGREEDPLQVPIAVSALPGTDLEIFGIGDSTQLIGSIPGLSFSANALSPGRDLTFLVLRGVGADAQIEPSTATFVDNVYLPSLAFDMDFLEVERVEVLRGPQGALFGRNAQAGAIHLVTKEPSRQLRGKVRLGVDEFESARILATVGGPVASRASANFTGQFHDTDGFIENTTFDEPADARSEWALRGSLSFSLGEDWRAILRADGLEDRGDGYAPGVVDGCRCYEVSSEFRESFEAKSRGGSFHLFRDFGGTELSAITGLRRLSNSQPFDFDGTNEYIGNVHDLYTDQELLSQELRLRSSETGGERWSWLAGVYVFDETLFTLRRYSLPELDTVFAGIAVRQAVTTDRQGLALFGRAEISLGDRYELALGARYSRQEVDNLSDVDGRIPLIGFVLDFTSPAAATFEDFSPSVSFLMRWSDRLMTYATVSQGFKPGGFDIAPGAQLNVRPVDSETSTNFELGLKAESADRRLSGSGALYRVDLDDQQLQSVVVIDGVPFSALVNAGKSHTQGLELELAWDPVAQLGVELNVGYVETEFDEYVDASGFDRAGEPFAYTPELSGSLMVDFASALGPSNRTLRGYGRLRYVDDYFIGLDIPFGPRFDLDSYEILDVGLALDTERWGITLFADNLLDDYVPIRTWNAFFFAGDLEHRTTVLPPRRVGLTFDFRF